MSPWHDRYSKTIGRCTNCGQYIPAYVDESGGITPITRRCHCEAGIEAIDKSRSRNGSAV